MVSVFGLYVPLVQLLVIFLILLTAGLVFILVELKKLRQILLEERNFIHQFEQDLIRFEHDEGKVHNDQVEAYVRTALGRGVPKDKIEDVLVGRGWDRKVIQKILGSSK